MKAIILISSIFYILGLKVGNNINLTIDSTSVKKVITTPIPGNNHESAVPFNNQENTNKLDSLKIDQGLNKLMDTSK